MHINSINNANYVSDTINYKNRLPKMNVSFSSNAKFYEQIEDILYKQMDYRRHWCSNTRYHCIQGYMEALKHFPVTKFMALGGECAVFELSNDRQVLKLSSEQFAPFVPKYHAREYERGTFALSRTLSATNDKYHSFATNELYYVIQEKGVPCIDESQYSSIIEQAKKDGYYLCDIKTDQFATCADGIKIIDINTIVKDKDYFLNRDLLACSKKAKWALTGRHSHLYWILYEYFPDTPTDLISELLETIEQPIKDGEPLMKVLKDSNLLSRLK